MDAEILKQKINLTKDAVKKIVEMFFDETGLAITTVNISLIDASSRCGVQYIIGEIKLDFTA